MHPLKIGVAARGLDNRLSGPNEFTHGLIQAFLDSTPNIQVYLYYDSSNAQNLYPKAKERVLSSKNRLLWDHILLPNALKNDDIDIIILPKGTIPFYTPCNTIAIMHDLGYFYPKLNAYKFLESIYFRINMRYTAKKAWGIFTVSEYTRQDVLRLLPAQRDKVITIYEAPHERYQRITELKKLTSLREHYRLQEPFIFYPTSISPRKNIIRVLDAFESIKAIIPHHLYFTGSSRWNAANIIRRLKEVGLHSRVHLLGAVPPEDMPGLYSLSQYAIYPSLFEGFGLPVVEAFRCGTPILISNLTSLPEVGGNAALIVDGYSTESIKLGLLHLAQDEALRQELIQKGYNRAKEFTWARTIKIIYDWLEHQM